MLTLGRSAAAAGGDRDGSSHEFALLEPASPPSRSSGGASSVVVRHDLMVEGARPAESWLYTLDESSSSEAAPAAAGWKLP